MKIQLLHLVFDPDTEGFDSDDLHELSESVNILSAKAAFFQFKSRAFWSVFVCYEELKSSPKKMPTYPELNAKQENLLKQLKSWRNQKAEKAGFPPYIIASNQLLKEICIRHPKSLSKLMELHGFGKQKAAKYGNDILEILKKHSL